MDDLSCCLRELGILTCLVERGRSEPVGKLQETLFGRFRMRFPRARHDSANAWAFTLQLMSSSTSGTTEDCSCRTRGTALCPR